MVKPFLSFTMRLFGSVIEFFIPAIVFRCTVTSLFFSVIGFLTSAMWFLGSAIEFLTFAMRFLGSAIHFLIPAMRIVFCGFTGNSQGFAKHIYYRNFFAIETKTSTPLLMLEIFAAICVFELVAFFTCANTDARSC